MPLGAWRSASTSLSRGSRCQYAKRYAQVLLGEVHSRASAKPRAEGQQLRRAAIDIETIRAIEDFRVAVRCGNAEQHRRVSGDLHSLELNRVLRLAESRLSRDRQGPK